MRTAALCLVLSGLAGFRASAAELLRFDEPIRRLATFAPLPAYPAAAIRTGCAGVVVANIDLSPSRQVSAVEILEAPCAAAAKAVTDSLWRWRFSASAELTATQALPANATVQGKLFFYFVKEKTGYRVFQAKDAPNVPRTWAGNVPGKRAPSGRPAPAS